MGGRLISGWIKDGSVRGEKARSHKSVTRLVRFGSGLKMKTSDGAGADQPRRGRRVWGREEQVLNDGPPAGEKQSCDGRQGE